eukprot:5054005-Prymnesium_polylepis.1
MRRSLAVGSGTWWFHHSRRSVVAERLKRFDAVSRACMTQHMRSNPPASVESPITSAESMAAHSALGPMAVRAAAAQAGAGVAGAAAAVQRAGRSGTCIDRCNRCSRY